MTVNKDEMKGLGLLVVVVILAIMFIALVVNL